MRSYNVIGVPFFNGVIDRYTACRYAKFVFEGKDAMSSDDLLVATGVKEFHYNQVYLAWIIHVNGVQQSNWKLDERIHFQNWDSEYGSSVAGNRREKRGKELFLIFNARNIHDIKSVTSIRVQT